MNYKSLSFYCCVVYDFTDKKYIHIVHYNDALRIVYLVWVVVLKAFERLCKRLPATPLCGVSSSERVTGKRIIFALKVKCEVIKHDSKASVVMSNG